MHRIYLAFLCFFRVLFGKPLPEELVPALPEAPATPALPPPAPTPAPVPVPTPMAKKEDGAPGALLLLGMLQREGRLIDFLCESIDGYDDASIGVAVRDIHRGLKKVLDEHFTVEPVLPGEENQSVTVGVDFDPSRIRLVGNVSGKPPFTGVLRHHGWRAAKVKLPDVPDVDKGIDTSVVAPAEVELS